MEIAATFAADGDSRDDRTLSVRLGPTADSAGLTGGSRRGLEKDVGQCAEHHGCQRWWPIRTDFQIRGSRVALAFPPNPRGRTRGTPVVARRRGRPQRLASSFVPRTLARCWRG